MIFFILINHLICNNFSIIANLSKDFNNYRHTTNILVIQEIFKNTNSVILSQENILSNKRNPTKQIYLDQTTILPTNIKTTNINLNKLIDILMLNHIDLMNINNSSNLTIYLTGHGGELFMKILDRDFLLNLDFDNIITYLSNRVNKLLIIIDTCKAESLVNVRYDNVCYIVTSKKDESSVSMAQNGLIGVATIDGFCKVFWEERMKNHDVFIEDYLELFTNERVGSMVIFFGKKKTFKLREFTEAGEDKLLKFVK